MPRDVFTRIHPGPFKYGLEGLKQLRDELREPLPENFVWDFTKEFHKTECGSTGCAMGLAHILWPHDIKNPIGIPITSLAEMFGLDFFEHRALFYREVDLSVTRLEVADRIDVVLARKLGEVK